jgi:hypothetical protein
VVANEEQVIGDGPLVKEGKIKAADLGFLHTYEASKSRGHEDPAGQEALPAVTKTF